MQVTDSNPAQSERVETPEPSGSLWTTAAVFAIGAISILFLILADRTYDNERLDTARSDALMDLQIHLALAHLWLEETLDGHTSPDDFDGIAEMERAGELIDAVINAGPIEHGFLPKKIENEELLGEAERIRSQLLTMKSAIELRLRKTRESQAERGQLEPHDKLFKRILAESRALEHIIEKESARERVRSRFLFWATLFCWMLVVIGTTAGVVWRETLRQRAEKALLSANRQLHAQSTELAEHRLNLTTLVEERTRELSEANERLLFELGERKRTEEALTKKGKEVGVLSARLLGAQEVERKRIAMGLHDELGQALNVIKLRLGALRRSLNHDQTGLPDDWDDLSAYVDHVIEDVRRLSLNLSPTILEDLGLTSALLWLMNNFQSTTGVKVNCDLEEIEDLVPPGYHIVIYRIVQEALTNIGKHAQARTVSFTTRKRIDSIVFSVEDDGRGFDPAKVVDVLGSEEHFGLATMKERANMMGGHLELRSDAKGTRITFDIPIEAGVL